MRCPGLSSLIFATAVNAISISVSSTGGKPASPLQYGLMFEDINHSGDGGIYAELIQNRAFQGANSTSPWTAIGSATLSLQSSQPALGVLKQSINVKARSADTETGITNPGWWGIEVKPQTYTGSFYVLGSYNGSFTAQLQGLNGTVLASAKVPSKSKAGKWTKHEFKLHPRTASPNVNNTFSLTYKPTSAGESLNFNLISLFPPTYNNRPNGLRVDLMKALKALNPSFFRIAGGNNIEGDYSPNHWRWYETIGDLTQRPGRPGTWSYHNTDGLGLIEYMQWCEDLEAEPVLAFPAGLYLDKTIIPQSALQPLVDDALNALEFSMGGPETKYGKQRIKLGYPEPFEVKFVEIGNEDNLNNGLPSYNAYRFSMFYNAIIAKYPKMNIIASTPNLSPQPGNTIIDDHHYQTPDILAGRFHFYDNTSATHKVMVGEYAAVQPNLAKNTQTDWDKPFQGYPFWIGAVSEAIYELGGEQNSDRMIGYSYAPLLQNINGHQWHPDLISFSADSSKTALSVSYQRIKLFSHNRVTTTLPSPANTPYGPAYWSAGINEKTQTYILKAAVYNTTTAQPFQVTFPGVKVGSTAELTVLTAPSGYSMVIPGGVNPVKTDVEKLRATSKGFEFELPQWSIAVLKTKAAAGNKTEAVRLGR